MGIIRGKIFHPVEMVTLVGEIGGKWLYIKCECGKWLDPKTNEHVKSYNLKELLQELNIEENPKCPDNGDF